MKDSLHKLGVTISPVRAGVFGIGAYLIANPDVAAAIGGAAGAPILGPLAIAAAALFNSLKKQTEATTAEPK